MAEPVNPRLIEGYGRRPLAFEANRGQTDSRVKFLSRAPGYNLFLAPDEAVLSLRKSGSPSRALRLRWLGANPAARISGRRELSGKVHYLKGNDPARWWRDVPTYGQISYERVYPGTDLVFYGSEGELEYDFVLAPGADPRALRLAIEGADRLAVDPSGDLVIGLGADEVRLRKPVAYQEVNGIRQAVATHYRLLPGGGRVGFETGTYDRKRNLIIDPVLTYATYLGGNDDDLASAVATDPAGNTYVTGITGSSNFPNTTGLAPAVRNYDAYVTKLDAAGRLVYSTIFGSSLGGAGRGVAVDSAGHAFVAGGTAGSDFPRVGGLPVSASNPRSGDAFIVEFDSSGSSFVYSTLLGGSGPDVANDLAIDSQGAVYVTGNTWSSDFPTAHALFPSNAGDVDAFVAKLSPGGSSLVYSTYLGSSSEDYGFRIAVDSAGQAHVIGATGSLQGFPTANALYAVSPDPPYAHAFVSKLDPAGSSLVYSTYFFGARGWPGSSIATDSAGNAYIAGETSSSLLPILNAVQPAPGGGEEDAFVTKLSPAGSILYSTYLGGSGMDRALGIAVDGAGRAYVTGATASTDYPLKEPLQSECRPVTGPSSCFSDAFVTVLTPLGSGLLFSTYLGGSRPVDGNDSADDLGLGIAVARGNIHVVGITYTSDFPVVNAFQPVHGGGLAYSQVDAFVAKIAFNHPPDCSAAFASPATLWPPNGRLVPVAIRNVIDPDGDPVTITVTGVRQDEPTGGSPSAFGIGTPDVSLRADRAGGGDGRIYRLSFTATDPQGASCTGTVTVCVPHDQGLGSTCGDGGGLFNSGG